MTSVLAEAPAADADSVRGLLQPWLSDLRSGGGAQLSGCESSSRRAAWQSLCDGGLAGVLVPRRNGGLGRGLLEAVSVADAITSLGVSLPFLSSAVWATLAARATHAEGLLSELATGDRIATVTVGGRLTGPAAAPRLTGVLRDVWYGADADCWLVLAERQAGQEDLVLIDRPRHEPSSQTSERHLVRGQVESERVVVLARDARRIVTTAALAAELVRCAEVCRAAELALAPDDTVGHVMLHAAAGLVRHTAAAGDLDGRLDASAVALLGSWVQRLATHVPELPRGGEQWAWRRAQRGSPWQGLMDLDTECTVRLPAQEGRL